MMEVSDLRRIRMLNCRVMSLLTVTAMMTVMPPAMNLVATALALALALA
jgi:hypothetical protein